MDIAVVKLSDILVEEALADMCVLIPKPMAKAGEADAANKATVAKVIIFLFIKIYINY